MRRGWVGTPFIHHTLMILCSVVLDKKKDHCFLGNKFLNMGRGSCLRLMGFGLWTGGVMF